MAAPNGRSALPPPPPDVYRSRGGRRDDARATTEVAAARALTGRAASLVQSSQAFQQLPRPTRDRILRDLAAIRARLSGTATTASSLGTPLDFRRGMGPVGAQPPAAEDGTSPSLESESDPTAARRPQATETLARRAGALSDELDFPDFVAGLVHGTFDAIVDASIRQMETFADLVASIAKTTSDFTRDNVSANQARDWLAQQYPKDLALDLSDPPRIVPKPPEGDDGGEPLSPPWLTDFGLEGEELTEEFVEEELVPRARERVGQNRLQTLATMVLLGMNRVVVRDGSISARLRLRAVAADRAKVDYAASDDPSQGNDWGTRGSAVYALPSTKVSTVGVNVQAETELRAELFGEVKINFVSETLPLDRFVDDARRTLLERHARPGTAVGTREAATAPAEAALPPAAAAPMPAPPPAAVPGSVVAPPAAQPGNEGQVTR